MKNNGTKPCRCIVRKTAVAYLSAKIYVKLILIKSIISFVHDSFYFPVDFYFCLKFHEKCSRTLSRMSRESKIIVFRIPRSVIVSKTNAKLKTICVSN